MANTHQKQTPLLSRVPMASTWEAKGNLWCEADKGPANFGERSQLAEDGSGPRAELVAGLASFREGLCHKEQWFTKRELVEARREIM